MVRDACRALLLACALSGLGGCASLEPREDDSLPETVGKVVVAVPVAIGSLLFCGFASGVAHRSDTLALDDELGRHDSQRERGLRELR